MRFLLILNFISKIFAPFIDLNTFDLTLGINVNLLRYMNNQPIRLMSKSARKNQPIFIIEFDLLKPGSSNSVAAASSDEEQFHDAKE